MLYQLKTKQDFFDKGLLSKVFLEKPTYPQTVKKFPVNLWKYRIHYRVQNNLLVVRSLCQVNPNGIAAIRGSFLRVTALGVAQSCP
jgi:hypothetical protein